MSSRDSELWKRNKIQDVVIELEENDHYLDSIASIVDSVNESIGIEVKPREVRNVLKQDFNMSYRKIKEVSTHVNSEKNLVLRQRFAMEFI